MEVRTTDVLVVGGGSGGVAAAIRAARGAPGRAVTIIDGMAMLGGTSTAGGVNCWEPGVGGLGLHRELYDRLARIPLAIGVGKTTHFYSKEEPYGLSQVDPDCPYEASLRRSATTREDVRRVHFEPDHLAAAMAVLCAEAGVAVEYGTRCIDVRTEGRRVTSVIAQPDGGEPYEIRARYFVDGSGGVHLARAAGCATDFGEDPAARYDEPSAPVEAAPVVNGASLIFRVTPVDEPAVETPPPAACAPDAARWAATHYPATQINEYPNGDLNLNILPVMDGAEFHNLPYAEAMRLCQARVWAHWTRLQREQGFDRYRMAHLFPLVGVRESHRLVGRTVLREQDVRAGILRQEGRAEIVACADHALDTHGRTNVKGAKLRDLDQPYGVPYGCLLPRELDNLIVASRGASFSHIAAASCRLSRTMMAIGEAAGVATALALTAGHDYADVPVDAIRAGVRIPEFLDQVVAEWGLAVTA